LPRFLAAVALLCAFTAFVGPWPLPSTPIDETAEGKAALADAAVLGARVRDEALRARPGSLRAGLGRREIAVPLGPEKGVLLGGYGIRCGIRPAPSLEVDAGNACFARALALETTHAAAGPPGLQASFAESTRAVLLAADLLYVGVETRRRVLAALEKDPGIDPARVMFTATHSHSAPGEYAGGPAEAIAVGKFREEVVAGVVAALVGAAQDAVRDLAPATLSVARASAPAFTRNRYWALGERDPPPPLDADLTVLRVHAHGEAPSGAGSASGRLRGLFAIYGAHATVIGPWVPRVSGDWPGALAAALERGSPGLTALVAAGPVGSQAPVPPEVPHDTAHGGEDEDQRAFHEAKAMGDALAAIARDLLSQGVSQASVATTPPAAGPMTVGLATEELPLPPVLFRLAPGWRASPLFVEWLYPTPARAPFSVLRVGKDVLLGVPCEVSGEVSLAMKARAAANGVRLTVTSFSGHYHGYVPPDACYPRFRYENTLSLHGERHAAFLEAIAAAAAAP